MDRERLIKIMGLTTSSSDGEALSALRKANEILAGEKLTWAEVLEARPSVTVTVTRQQAPQSAYSAPEDWMAAHLKDKVTIDMMFRAIFSQPRTGNEEFWQWVESVHHWFNEKGSLTARQYTALRQCYQRTVRAS